MHQVNQVRDSSRNLIMDYAEENLNKFDRDLDLFESLKPYGFNLVSTLIVIMYDWLHAQIQVYGYVVHTHPWVVENAVQ